MYIVPSLLILWCFTPGLSLSYPVFGTKRYQRASEPSVPYYNQYHDQVKPLFVQPNYQDGYVTENGYYYYPNHEYHSYGLPTYHGDYKPSPYYYAAGPRYSFFDDRVMASNPMDDLHEEILQEDERERVRELSPPYGEESWFQNVGQQQDTLTNNFLKNLIEYNRQIDDQQNDQDLMQRDQPNEYDEYTELEPSDYVFDPNTKENLYELKKFRKQDNPSILPTHKEKFNEIEDENVRQLKSLAMNQPNKNSPSNVHSIEHLDKYQEAHPNWQQTPLSYMQYDSEPEEYDDDSWINWDRKRSSNMMGRIVPKDEPIKFFTNRKPSLFTDRNVSTKKPSTTIPTKSMASITTTTTTTSNGKHKSIIGQKEVVLPRPAVPQHHLFAAPVLELINNNSVDKSPTQDNNHLGIDLQKDEDNQRSKVNDKSENIYDTIKQLIAMEQQLEKTTESKLQKRFVSNEESLVHELDNLKRRSI